jgi:O-antigen ligase
MAYLTKNLSTFVTVSVWILFLSVFSSASGIGLGTAILGIFGTVFFWPELKRINRLPLFFPILFFCLAVVLSILFAEGHGFGKPLGKLRYFYFFFLLVLYFRQRPDLRTRLAEAAVPFSALLLVICLMQFTGVFCPMRALGLIKVELAKLPGTDGRFFHARGLLYHHNPFAYTTLLLLFLMLGQYLTAGSSRLRAYYGSGVAMALVCIALSGSRGSWLALAISSFFVFVFFVQKSAKLYAAFLAFSVGVALVLWGPLGQRIQSIRLEKNSDRIRLWEISWEMFREAPLLGQGYHLGFELQRNRFMTDKDRQDPHFPTDPHSAYFDLLATTGLLGFGTFLWFLFSGCRNYVVGLRKISTGPKRAFLIAGLGAWICFIIGAGFDSHFFHTQTLMATLFFLAIGQSCTSTVQNRRT